MNRTSFSLIGGLLLISLGLLFLMDYLNILEVGSWIWGGLVALGGFIFIGVFWRDREQWWSLVPGVILLGVSAAILLANQYGGRWGELGSVVVLLSIGLAFLAVYLVRRENWWAIIPMGVLISLAVFVGWDRTGSAITPVGLFILGLGLTFLLVALLPTPEGQMRWAFIPGGILCLIGFFLAFNLFNFWVYLLPFSLILIGLLILFRTLTKRQ